MHDTKAQRDTTGIKFSAVEFYVMASETHIFVTLAAWFDTARNTLQAIELSEALRRDFARNLRELRIPLNIEWNR